MKRLTLLMTTFAATLLFAGCGQSGPLYVPGNPSQMAVPPSQNTADEEEQQENDDSSKTE